MSKNAVKRFKPSYLMTSTERENPSLTEDSKPKQEYCHSQAVFGLSYEQPTYFFTKHSIYNEKSYKSPFYGYDSSPEGERAMNSSRTINSGKSIRNFQDHKLYENTDEKQANMSIVKLDPLVLNDYIRWDTKKVNRSDLYYAERSLNKERYTERLNKPIQFKKTVGEISFYESHRLVSGNKHAQNEKSVLQSSINTGSHPNSISKLDLLKSNLSERTRLPSLKSSNASAVFGNKSLSSKKFERNLSAPKSAKILKIKQIRHKLNQIHDGKIQKLKERTADFEEIANFTAKNIIFNQIIDKLQKKNSKYINEKLEKSFNQDYEEKKDFDSRVRLFNLKKKKRDDPNYFFDPTD